MRSNSGASDKGPHAGLKPVFMWYPNKIGRPKENSRREPYAAVLKRNRSHVSQREEDISKVEDLVAEAFRKGTFTE